MRPDLLWRAVPPAAALMLLAADAPRSVSGGLALLGLVLSAERLARSRRLGLTDRVLLVVGGSLATLVLTGMLLGSTGIGLRPTTWVTSLALLSAAGLVLARVDPGREMPATPSQPGTRRTGWLLLPWVAVAAVVAVFAVHVSARSLSAVEAAPLEMSFGQVDGTRVQVVVSASEAMGPFEVRTSADGNEISYPLISVEAEGSTATTVSLPTTGRYLITLSYPDQTQPLRSLVLDR